MTLALESLSKSFGDEQVLAGVDLSVADGEFCVILGPSGCGKTTLLNCVAGLERPDGGDVRLHGESVRGRPVAERGFGVVFQDFEDRLFPHMTVRENVAFGLRQDGDLDGAEIEERVDDVLDLLAIADTGEDLPPNLSGGQQQRVELARQLVREVDTLLLDDPLSDLDYKLQKRLELELRRLHAEEADTVLYVTHNQDQSLKLADRLVVLNDGRVEQVGTPEAVYHRPETAFVARFVGDSNLVVGTATGTEGDATVVETPLGEVRAAAGADADVGTGTGDAGSPPTEASESDGPAGEGAVVVRPERVGFGTGENTVSGTLEQRIYTGETTEFVVSVPGDVPEFRVQKAGDVPLDAVGAAVGATVDLSWAAADTHYFGPAALSVTGSLSAADLTEV